MHHIILKSQFIKIDFHFIHQFMQFKNLIASKLSYLLNSIHHFHLMKYFHL